MGFLSSGFSLTQRREGAKLAEPKARFTKFITRHEWPKAWDGGRVRHQRHHAWPGPWKSERPRCSHRSLDADRVPPNPFIFL